MLKFFRKMINSEKGFTIIELIVVLAILAIIAAIAVPRFGNIQNKAKIDADKVTLKTVEKAAELYAASSGIEEDTAADLVTAGYLESVPVSQEDGDTTITITWTSGKATATYAP